MDRSDQGAAVDCRRRQWSTFTHDHYPLTICQHPYPDREGPDCALSPETVTVSPVSLTKRAILG
ncbi:hypothetical protein GCM10020255_086460 [Rhodococcus baikonurensis]